MAGIYFGLLALGAALVLPLAAIGAGIGQGMAAFSALQGIARQPEAADKIQTTMFICLGIIEALAIYAFVIFFILFTKFPTAEQVTQLLTAH
ncbi:MAG: hypothetical protein JWQ02_2469 [Capsulimonas sp.]|jgi:F-type H+-transporting ATPase subunit c|nr:hypothetical protein [Capsulimonas sp.]